MNSEKLVLPSWYSDEELMRMSSENPELRFERNADSTLETMPSTGGISVNREIKAGSQDIGEVFSASTGFRLANTAV
jgi:Uma2 family endonuclease